MGFLYTFIAIVISKILHIVIFRIICNLGHPPDEKVLKNFFLALSGIENCRGMFRTNTLQGSLNCFLWALESFFIPHIQQ